MLKASCILLAEGSAGLYGRWRNIDGVVFLFCCLLHVALVFLIASMVIFLMVSNLCPRATSRSTVFMIYGIASSLFVQSRDALLIAPYIKLLVVPGEWQECGGMYRCRFISFSYILVTIFLFLIVMFKSRNIADSSLLLNSHSSLLEGDGL